MGKTEEKKAKAHADVVKSSKESSKPSKRTKDSQSSKPKVVDKKQLAEIDDLFSSAKTAKLVKKEEEEQTVSEPKPKKKRPSTDESESRPYGVMKSAIPMLIISPEAPLERIDTESGLPVYKAHLLKVGEGGGTPLCPFDCDCCF